MRFADLRYEIASELWRMVVDQIPTDASGDRTATISGEWLRGLGNGELLHLLGEDVLRDLPSWLVAQSRADQSFWVLRPGLKTLKFVVNPPRALPPSRAIAAPVSHALNGPYPRDDIRTTRRPPQ